MVITNTITYIGSTIPVFCVNSSTIAVKKAIPNTSRIEKQASRIQAFVENGLPSLYFTIAIIVKMSSAKAAKNAEITAIIDTANSGPPWAKAVDGMRQKTSRIGNIKFR